jgi:hypothetical protein
MPALIAEKTALVRLGLEALIAREAGKRLAALGGNSPIWRTLRGGDWLDGAPGQFSGQLEITSHSQAKTRRIACKT